MELLSLLFLICISFAICGVILLIWKACDDIKLNKIIKKIREGAIIDVIEDPKNPFIRIPRYYKIVKMQDGYIVFDKYVNRYNLQGDLIESNLSYRDSIKIKLFVKYHLNKYCKFRYE
jgi:hypothetical protein